ncbi:MAG: hypothetical protein C4293_16025 [Nitrospiraceae bacterium]
MVEHEPGSHENVTEPFSRIRTDSARSERTWTFIIIGVVLLIASISYLWRSSSLFRTTPTAAVPQLSSAMVPLATGEESIAQLFTRAGCVVCHAIPGVPGADGRVGPKLVLGSTGPKRLADPAYHGQAKTVREYVTESILTPGTYVVPGYSDSVMPRWYGQKLSAGALDKIVGYLEGLIDEAPVSKSE